MKRRLLSIVFVFLTAAFILITISDATARDNKKKDVVLSTVDIDEDYEILGLIHYRSSELGLKKMHKELKKQAKKMGADYVVGIIYFSHSGYLYGSGTAVKLIDDDSKK